MIFGIGVDIIQVTRIKHMVEKYGAKFLTRVFTSNEIDYSEEKVKSRLQHYAARWAAKEALFKALKGDWQSGIAWKDIEVINEKRGNPNIVLHNAAAELKEKLGITSLELSLSHTDESASAIVVAEKAD